MSCNRSTVTGSTGGDGGGKGGGISAPFGGPVGGGSGAGGPCGACKFLRRKCVSGCVFAPHFDAEAGAEHFAAVHRVFGASNASKLLQRLPPHRRPHAVLTMCYEAHARLRDPVLGCVSHIFALQQQVVNLEAELGLIQAHLSPLHQPEPAAPQAAQQPSLMSSSYNSLANGHCCPSDQSGLSTVFDPLRLHPVTDAESCCVQPSLQQVENDVVEALAQEYFSKCLHGVKFPWPDSISG